MANDLFSLSGNEVADYLTDSGEVDTEKVAADVAAVLAERPGLRSSLPDTTRAKAPGAECHCSVNRRWPIFSNRLARTSY